MRGGEAGIAGAITAVVDLTVTVEVPRRRARESPGRAVAVAGAAAGDWIKCSLEIASAVRDVESSKGLTELAGDVAGEVVRQGDAASVGGGGGCAIEVVLHGLLATCSLRQ
jgi:hypothetical protein